jgi:hypothetical protein
LNHPGVISVELVIRVIGADKNTPGCSKFIFFCQVEPVIAEKFTPVLSPDLSTALNQYCGIPVEGKFVVANINGERMTGIQYPFIPKNYGPMK